MAEPGPNTEYTRFVILLEKVTGRETPRESILRHVEHLRRLDQAGQLVLCGPFTDYPAGIVVVKARDIAEAERIAKSDPFVSEGVRTFHIRTLLMACEGNGYLA